VRMESRSLVVVPLETGGKRLGVLVVTSSEPGRHGDEDFELVSELARRVALADAEHRIVLLNDELERVWGAPISVGYDHRESDVPTAGWPLERAIDKGEVTLGERREVERD